MFTRKVELRAHAELTPAVEDDVLVTADVGPRGEVVALWSTAEGREALLGRDVRPGGASFPATRTAPPVAARLTRHTPDRDAVVRLDGLSLAHCHVQPLPSARPGSCGSTGSWRRPGRTPTTATSTRSTTATR